jgi:hypothetical protein
MDYRTGRTQQLYLIKADSVRGWPQAATLTGVYQVGERDNAVRIAKHRIFESSRPVPGA